MANTSWKLRIFAALAILLGAALYLIGLTRMGMYSADEPRYADIGRAMARTGDWITPRLWGVPWFEKPPLLYWMTAAGFKLGLGDDLAPRLPVALLSVAFLAFFWFRLRQLFDRRVANSATAMLATTGGWLAYSHVAVTDLPVSVFFSAAVLLALPGKDGTAQPKRVAAAIALGLAVLAKSLPSLVLFLPILILDWRNWRRWFASWPVVAFLAVALPWHVIATMRDGWDFLRVLFLEQQLGRFLNSSRAHGQSWWYYGPVFLLLLFPWFPLLPLAFRAAFSGKQGDPRARNLAAVVIVGLIFFSASINKLSGYVLPLLPATCVLMGLGLARSLRCGRWLIAPIALIGALPLAASILPEIAGHGLKSARIPWSSGVLGLAIATLAAIGIALVLRFRTLPAAILVIAGGFIWLETDLFPALDQTASARPLWLTSHPECAPVLARPIVYGLYYYSGKQLPDCAIFDKNAAIPTGGGAQTHQ